MAHPRGAALLTWQSSRDEYNNATEESIAHLYDARQSSSLARRLSETIVVKRCLPAPGKREFQNQVHAWHELDNIRLRDGRGLRIPEPIRYFESRGAESFNYGYIVMEYLHGTILEDSLCKDDIPIIAEAITLIHGSTARSAHARPGPLDGGLAEGFPWGEHGAECPFSTIFDVQHAIDKRLRLHLRSQPQLLKPLRLYGRALGLCHLTMVPRNIMMLDSGDIGVLDWSAAAYYPIEFQFASLSYFVTLCEPRERDFLAELLSKVEQDSNYDKEDLKNICIVQELNLRIRCESLMAQQNFWHALPLLLTRIVH